MAGPAMPDFTQSPPGLQPPTVIDHVLLPVADLDRAVEEMRDRYGLEAAAGGRHPNLGTANRIVPLGRQYLELIAVADRDEAAGAAASLGRAVEASLTAGQPLLTWALRTQDLDALRRKLEDAGWSLPETWSGQRRRPDGVVLRWRTQDLVARGAITPLPFVIEWDIPDELHPGRVAAAGGVRLDRVIVGAHDAPAARERLAVLLGGSELYEVRPADRDGLISIVLDAGGRRIVIE